MARARGCGDSWRAAALVWSSTTLLIYLAFRFALKDSISPSFSDPGVALPSPSSMAGNDLRVRLYDRMARDLDERGATFLRRGETSQALSISDIFEMKDGIVQPVLKEADPPVRANVLHMSLEYALPISHAIRDVFLPYFDKAIWFQNASLYHSSLFHASHHLTPIPATRTEIETEISAVKSVAEVLCPLKVILDRVVLTSTGVLLGCWQVISGTDPLVIRASLKKVLPRAPEKQLYDPVILHTSFARLLGHPNAEVENATAQLTFFHDLVANVSKKLHGFQATISELWSVEEFDVLALALNGRMKIHRFPLGCSEIDRHR